MAKSVSKPVKRSKVFYVVAPALGLTSIWLLGWGEPRMDILGKIISSVLFVILFYVVMWGIGWNRNRQLKQKIRGAVLSPRP